MTSLGFLSNVIATRFQIITCTYKPGITTSGELGAYRWAKYMSSWATFCSDCHEPPSTHGKPYRRFQDLIFEKGSSPGGVEDVGV